MTDLDRLGGLDGIGAITRAFIDRCADDFVIGFLFHGADLQAVAHHEFELAARLFGAEVPYTGRPLAAVHRPRRIHRGHHRRRQAILRTVLEEHGVPDDLVARWLAHQERFRDVVTTDGDCVG